MWPFSNNHDKAEALGRELSAFLEASAISIVVKRFGDTYLVEMDGERIHRLSLEVAMLRIAMLNNMLFMFLGAKPNLAEKAFFEIFRAAQLSGKVFGFDDNWNGPELNPYFGLLSSNSVGHWAEYLGTRFVERLQEITPEVHFSKVKEFVGIEIGAIQSITVDRLGRVGLI